MNEEEKDKLFLKNLKSLGKTTGEIRVIIIIFEEMLKMKKRIRVLESK